MFANSTVLGDTLLKTRLVFPLIVAALIEKFQSIAFGVSPNSIVMFILAEEKKLSCIGIELIMRILFVICIRAEYKAMKEKDITVFCNI